MPSSFSSPSSIHFTWPSRAPSSCRLSLVTRKLHQDLQAMQKQGTIQLLGGARCAPTGIEHLKPGCTQMTFMPSCGDSRSLDLSPANFHGTSELWHWEASRQRPRNIPAFSKFWFQWDHQPSESLWSRLSPHVFMAPPKWKSKIPPVGATTPEISKVARVQNSKTSAWSARTTASQTPTDSPKFLAFNQWPPNQLL